jgi:acyl carrier protein
MDMDEKEFLALLEEILEIDSGSLALGDWLNDYDWDSLAILGFIAAVDSRLDLTLEAARLTDVGTPAELLGLVDGARRA